MPSLTQIIVTSKDRPAQLELLLRSLHVAWQDPDAATVSVLYRSNAVYQEAYLALVRQFPRHRFVDETAHGSFKAGLLATLNRAASVYIFLVDDQVFLRPFQLGPMVERFLQLGPFCATVSLRLHPGVVYSYCFRTHSPPRTLANDSLQVRWADEPNNSDWSVVMSLDGNLYRRDDLLAILLDTDYANPCFVEYQLVTRTPFTANTYFLCQREPVIVTVPLNQTQDTHSHRHGALVDLAQLNQAYLDGARIALLPYWETTGGMVHREQVPVLLAPTPAKDASPAQTIVVDGRQPLPQLLRTLESAALLEPRPALQVVNASAESEPLLQSYRGILAISTTTVASATPIAPGTFLHSQNKPGEAAWQEYQQAGREELLRHEQRVMSGPQNPLSQYTWRNRQPVAPPAPTTSVLLSARLRRLRGDSFRAARQFAYDALATLAWKLGQPTQGGVRDKVVTLFAGRPATAAEMQLAQPPPKPWKFVKN